MAACSGRDDLCRSVLNDEWSSGPKTSIDDAGLYGATGGKPINVYEEALHRCVPLHILLIIRRLTEVVGGI